MSKPASSFKVGDRVYYLPMRIFGIIHHIDLLGPIGFVKVLSLDNIMFQMTSTEHIIHVSEEEFVSAEVLNA